MKKILMVLIGIIGLTGCGSMSNTPTKQVEGFFNKYQTLDKEVLDDLDEVVDKNNKFDTNSREEYKELIKNQYKNLEYKIKEEKIDGNTAIVTTEITVIDYAKVITESNNYKINHTEEFKNDNGDYDDVKYTSYLVSKLKDAKDKVKYTLDINLTETDKKWKMDGIDSETEEKILGIYQY